MPTGFCQSSLRISCNTFLAAFSISSRVIAPFSLAASRRSGKPVAMLSPYTGATGASRIGLLKGKLSFDAAWWKKDRQIDTEIASSFSEN